MRQVKKLLGMKGTWQGTVCSVSWHVLSRVRCPQVGEEVLGSAAKVEVSKDSTTIVGDGSTEDSVKARVRQIKNLIGETEQDYEKEKLNERVARLSGGVAIIQVCPYFKTVLI